MGNSSANLRGLSIVLLLGLLCTVFSACGDSDATYYAQFTWFQKDAYLDSVGHPQYCWPPHTATQLEVFEVEPPGSTPQAVWVGDDCNEGTCPGETDSEGNVILQEMRTETTPGSRDTLLALGAAFKQCGCANEFLSKSDILGTSSSTEGGAAAPHLDCQVVLEDVMDGLVATILASRGLDYDNYHVCNNLALQQATLWQNYVETGEVIPCDPDSSICAGPLWYYNPMKP